MNQIEIQLWKCVSCAFAKRSPSSKAAMFCSDVQAGPAPAQSHMICCQVPEKSNNVRNSLIRYAWLQLQHVGLWAKFVLIEDWNTLAEKGGLGALLGTRWEGKWSGRNMPMQMQACTPTVFSAVIQSALKMICGRADTKALKAVCNMWHLRALTTAVPSLPCRKEQKKSEGRKTEREVSAKLHINLAFSSVFA